MRSGPRCSDRIFGSCMSLMSALSPRRVHSLTNTTLQHGQGQRNGPSGLKRSTLGGGHSLCHRFFQVKYLVYSLHTAKKGTDNSDAIEVAKHATAISWNQVLNRGEKTLICCNDAIIAEHHPNLQLQKPRVNCSRNLDGYGYSDCCQIEVL